MGHKNTDFTNKLNQESESGNFYERDYSPWDLKKKAKLGPKGFKMSKKVPFSWLRIGFLILLILAFGGTLGTISGVNNRLKKIEEKVSHFKDIDDRIAQIREQVIAFELHKEHLDRVEASMTLKMENVIKDLNSLQKKIAESRPIKSVSSSPTKVDKKLTKNRYHIVRRGDTLYNISRMHGLTLKKIQIINKLSDSAVLRPGQKLFLGP